MTVSVVIPCFNAGRFLMETVESVFRQTYHDYEIIVVDDGSTDNSRAIIESFGARVQAEFGPNRGVSAARNRGTQLTKGEFIQYLDADDLLTPHALLSRVEALRKSNADVAYSDWQRLVEHGNGFQPGEIIARCIESVHADPQVALFTDFWCPPAALLYSRRIVERIGGWNETLSIIQDARFLLDAALHGGQFVHVPEVCALYRTHTRQSLSRFSSQAFVHECLQNAFQVEAYWRQEDAITDERLRAVLKVLGHIVRASFQRDPETFYRALYAANRLKPGWSPERPHVLRILSRLFGYPRAEGCALIYRRLKAILSLDRAT